MERDDPGSRGYVEFILAGRGWLSCPVSKDVPWLVWEHMRPSLGMPLTAVLPSGAPLLVLILWLSQIPCYGISLNKLLVCLTWPELASVTEIPNLDVFTSQ